MEGDPGDQEQKEPVAPASRSTPVAERSHALHVFTGRLTARLDELGSVLTATMTQSERAETLAELVRCQDRFAAVIATLIADDPNAVGTLGASANLTARTRRRLARRSRVLAGHPQVHAALASGQIRTDQAQVITTAVDRLPGEVAHLAKEAETHLLGLAADHDADELKNLAHHLLHVIAPDQADELLAAQLEREERDARRTAFLTISRDGQGSTWVKGKIPDLHGQILQTLLQAVANPGRPNPIDRTHKDLPAIKGQALCELLEKINTKDLPNTGGTTVSVVVTMTLDTLTGGLTTAGVLGTDLQLSPSQARRLAAAHGVIPVVLGGKSEILDLGRKRRFFTKAQRLALAIRQGGHCNTVGCDIPTTWCDANHRTNWAHRGRTDLNDGELICPPHHTDHHHGINHPRRT